MLLLKIILLFQTFFASAFVTISSPSIQQRRGGVSATRSFALCRPAWLRRASRIKQKSEANRIVYESLKERQKELGVGKLYRCCNPSNTMRQEKEDDNGLLNVYLNIPESKYEAEDPTNIINKLQHGEIVVALSPKEGIWIEHDGGGWSAMTIDGFDRLEPLGT